MEREPSELLQPDQPRPIIKKKLLATLLVLTVVSVTYRLLVGTEYATTSALYIGIPALLAVGLSFIPTPRSATGHILLWSTIFLLAIGILAIEGLICILVILPFFLAIGFLVGICIDITNAKRKARSNGHWKTQCSVLAICSLLSLEGTRDELSFNRNEVVTIKRTVDESPIEFENQLTRGPLFEKVDVPVLLKNTFPTPQACTGTDGLNLASVWTITFDHSDQSNRALAVEVIATSTDSVTFAPIADETEYANWLRWKEIVWQWEEGPAGTTVVTLTFEFERRLDPAWYFRPIQRRGVHAAGELFLDAVLVP